MLLGNRNQQGGIIGIELSDRYAQLSFWAAGTENPETPPQCPPELGEDTMIPVLLCKRLDRDVWAYGK